MIEKTLRNKPITSAQELLHYLKLLPEKVLLNQHQEKALHEDIKYLESLISELFEANSKEDWRKVWSSINNRSRNFGGYVGDQLGQKINQLYDALWRDILDSNNKLTD
jgi:hypothetical protein